ncbi:hypothetical protein AB0G15_12060 [Streptosporangium sp. NPDC023825]|uniref:hypothetical protein n=1 Tax=Streptosporangium sp. NPDC023825 TaxID=3154909 RepID=UPI003422F69D
MYDIGTLETAGRRMRELCHPAAAQPGRESAVPLRPEDAAPADTPPRPAKTTETTTTAARTRTAALAGAHREQATPRPPETTARTRTAALAGAPRRPAAPRIPQTTPQTPGKARAFQAQGSVQAPPAAVTSGKKAPAALEKPAEAHPPQAQQARQPTRLQQTDAKRLLRAAGLRWTSSGKCANRQGRNCTSLEAVRSETVSSAIELKRRSGCPLVVTGGTEVGHAPGPYSHYAGYKLDIKPNACINRYITKNYPSQGVRGDGARLYGQSATSGPLFAREADHWDILFR